ncbi:MAG: hypothetical protein ACJASX_003076, partial [Limisphaerales bacterium]
MSLRVRGIVPAKGAGLVALRWNWYVA